MYKKPISGWREIPGLFVQGHFELSAGGHAEEYFNKAMLTAYPRLTDKLCRELAGEFAHQRIEIVVAPVSGGCILSNRVASFLCDGPTSKEVLSLYMDKARGGFILKRGYRPLVAGKRVLVVDDVLTTGGTVRKMVDTLRGYDAEVVGVGIIYNRSGLGASSVGHVPNFHALLGPDKTTHRTWTPEECKKDGPCARSVLLSTEYGHSKDSDFDRILT